MKNYLSSAALLTLLSAQSVIAADNVVLITIDGVRWQEAFSGISAELATHEEYSDVAEQLMAEFWQDDPAQRAQKLMPFLHNTVMQ